MTPRQLATIEAALDEDENYWRNVAALEGEELKTKLAEISSARAALRELIERNEHMSQVGDRVLAVKNAKRDESGIYTVYVYGVGTYEGRQIPSAEACIPGGVTELMHNASIENPTIKLDSGELIYGCECWWGDLQAACERFGLKPDLTPIEPEKTTVSIVSVVKDRDELRKQLQTESATAEPTEA